MARTRRVSKERPRTSSRFKLLFQCGSYHEALLECEKVINPRLVRNTRGAFSENKSYEVWGICLNSVM